LSEWKFADIGTAGDSIARFAAAETRVLWRGPRAAALASAPISGLAPRRPESQRERFEQDSIYIAEATRLTALPSHQIAPLFMLLARADSASYGRAGAKPAALQAATLAALGDWIARSRQLTPAQRAAALLAADRLLASRPATAFGLGEDADMPGFDSIPYRTLDRLGAEFDNDHYAGMMYSHSWLHQAFGIDSTSPAGNLAFMRLVQSGCEPGPVIARGEPWLKIIGPTQRAELHFILGDAYADSVGIAAEVFLSPEYRKNAHDNPSARAKALEHYRAGLAIEQDSPRARDAWRTAWRLLAGQPPRRMRFYCEND